MSTELKTVAWGDLQTGRVWKQQGHPEHVALVLRSEAEEALSELQSEIARLRAALDAMASYPGVRVYVGTEIHDLALTAINPGEQG